ncbi:MAG: stage II sporulation protein D [Bacilli bacterium]|nr:stage II sporulation protein D [Bacilli bacterium]
MKNKILLVVVVVLGIIYLFIRSFVKETSFFINDNVTIKNVTTNVTETIDMEEYLVGVLAGEMPASFEMEALKAQAIASRTYAYYKVKVSNKDYDLTTDKSTQVYLTNEEMKNKWGNDYDYYLDKIKSAIQQTGGMVLTFENEIIPAYYFAMSNGYTENALTVFGENKSYLTSVVSKENENHRSFKVTKSISVAAFCNALGIECNNLSINNIIRNDANRVESININNKNFTGLSIRKLLDLRSTDFEFKVSDNNVDITTYGYGHGVGMSQYGANTMAKDGYNYDKILKHYYTGVEITSINSIN